MPHPVASSRPLLRLHLRSYCRQLRCPLPRRHCILLPPHCCHICTSSLLLVLPPLLLLLLLLAVCCCKPGLSRVKPHSGLQLHAPPGAAQSWQGWRQQPYVQQPREYACQVAHEACLGVER
jgi:hypothetical protein